MICHPKTNSAVQMTYLRDSKWLASILHWAVCFRVEADPHVLFRRGVQATDDREEEPADGVHQAEPQL